MGLKPEKESILEDFSVNSSKINESVQREEKEKDKIDEEDKELESKLENNRKNFIRLMKLCRHKHKDFERLSKSQAS